MNANAVSDSRSLKLWPGNEVNRGFEECEGDGLAMGFHLE